MPTKTFTGSGTFGPVPVPMTAVVKCYGGGAGGANFSNTGDTVFLDTPGSGDYAWPEGVNSATVECWGGGAGGINGSFTVGGGGGGSSAYTVKSYSFPVGSVGYSVGGGGTAGNNGASSTFDTMVADGGAAGSDGTAGTGGAASGGDTNVNGNDGTDGSLLIDGGPGGNGGDAPSGGTGGGGGVSGGPGASGTTPGAGGGGGSTFSGAGGLGADGLIKITLTLDTGGDGGGGGAYAEVFVSLDEGDSLVVTIPPIAAAATDGGDTYVEFNAIVIVKAVGGDADGTGGQFTDCIGDAGFSGGDGGARDVGGGGGGGCAGTSADGSDGDDAVTTTGGAGGAGGATGGGQGGDGGNSGDYGEAADDPGGGGGGGGSGFTGGNGGSGKVIIDYSFGPQWSWTGCYCCDWMLPDHFSLVMVGDNVDGSFTLPTAPLGVCPPCGKSTFGPLCIPNGWNKVFDETITPQFGPDAGIPIVVPVAWKSVTIGPFGGPTRDCPDAVACECYLTQWIWCNRDGEHPRGGPQGSTGYIPPGSWHQAQEFDDSCGYEWPDATFHTFITDIGCQDPGGNHWPCDYVRCPTLGPDGSFVVGFDSSGGPGVDLIATGTVFFFGLVDNACPPTPCPG